MDLSPDILRCVSKDGTTVDGMVLGGSSPTDALSSVATAGAGRRVSAEGRVPTEE
jgi:hypothetical protein